MVFSRLVALLLSFENDKHIMPTENSELAFSTDWIIQKLIMKTTLITIISCMIFYLLYYSTHYSKLVSCGDIKEKWFNDYLS